MTHLGSSDVRRMPQLTKNETVECKAMGISCLANMAGWASRLVYADYADAYIADIIKVGILLFAVNFT